MTEQTPTAWAVMYPCGDVLSLHEHRCDAEDATATDCDREVVPLYKTFGLTEAERSTIQGILDGVRFKPAVYVSLERATILRALLNRTRP